MITDIPTSDDMTTAGVNLLNLAWSIGVRLITDFKSDEMLTSMEGLADTYWEKSQPELTNGYAVIDQSIETLLKARITEVSPFLLLSRGLPGRASTQDAPFYDLQTVGGAGLFDLHNAVYRTRLPKAFDTFFEDIRARRNVIMHQPSSSRSVKVNELFTLVVQTYGHLFPRQNWLAARLRFRSGHPLQMSWNFETWALMKREMELLTGFLEANDLRTCFGYEKDSTTYWCPDCDQKFAQLRPDDPTTTNLHCCLCGEKTDVIRNPCGSCGGDVAIEVEAEGEPAGTMCLCCRSLDLNSLQDQCGWTHARSACR